MRRHPGYRIRTGVRQEIATAVQSAADQGASPPDTTGTQRAIASDPSTGDPVPLGLLDITPFNAPFRLS